VKTPASSTNSIGVFSVATNRYLEFWMSLARSADRYFITDPPVCLTVFTDQVEAVEAFARGLNRIQIQAVQIEPLGWPDAPLAKFQTVIDHEYLLMQDFLIHLDADMRIVSNLGDVLAAHRAPAELVVVKHPGFRRPPGFQRTALYRSHPKFALRDSYRFVREGGLGTWETNRESAAFVRRSLRGTYVCGATWMGERDTLIEACGVLAERVGRDSKRGVVARFHDESHLNWYAAHNRCAILESNYCFVENSPNLKDLEPTIVAVEKYENRTRQ
jgi:hypothetical protein